MAQMEFTGAVGVVTGAGNGIGAAIAHALARNGSKVAVADIDGEAAERVAASITEGGGDALGLAADVTDAERMLEVADAVYERFGEVDVLCNNAGVTMRPFRAIWDASPEDFEWIMRVNYFGVVNGLRAFLPRMLEQSGHRHIVNTSSMASLTIVHGHAMYTASKAALDALSDSLRSEFVDHDQDFGVTVLYPGPVKTEIMFRSESYRPEPDRSSNRELKEYPVSNPDGQGADAVAPEAVAEMLMRAIRANAPYCVTHPVDEPFLRRRVESLVAGYLSGEE